MKLVILDSYTAVSTDLSLDCLKELCPDCAVYDRTAKEDVVARIGDAELVIINKTILSADVLKQCKNVKYIGLFATGYNVVDIDYCKSHGIVVANVPGYSTDAVAQLVFGFILNQYSMVAEHNQKVHDGAWQNCRDFAFFSPALSELSGKTIGIVGFGSIGIQVAKLALAFHMNVLVFSRTIKKEYEQAHLHFTGLDTLLKKSDIVTLHCPLFPETKELIRAETLALMKPTALLINTARGGVVNEQDCADALNSGKLAAMAADVVSVEPICAENPLLSAKNCVLTPHMAWACHETRARLIDIVYENLKGFLEGTPKNNVAK